MAAMGNLWADGGERGLCKTTDAGKTWKLILKAAAPHDARTGCGDVMIDPTNPEIVYAALYARQRTPWSFASGPSVTGGEDVGGIFRSTNAGATWKKLGDGLPGQTGRIGLAISASNPKSRGCRRTMPFLSITSSCLGWTTVFLLFTGFAWSSLAGRCDESGVREAAGMGSRSSELAGRGPAGRSLS